MNPSNQSIPEDVHPETNSRNDTASVDTYVATHPGAFGLAEEPDAAPAAGGGKASLLDRLVGEGEVLLGKLTRNQETEQAGEALKAEGHLP